MYSGCPNRCVYCNERITAGNHPDRITEDLFRKIVDRHLESLSAEPEHIQIAFYGGNFTGMDRNYQRELLEYADSYIARGSVGSIRISTRPDYIDGKRIDLLKQYPVTTVEIGAQSMDNDVLRLSRRGHSSDDVKYATKLLMEHGFETGLHLMIGLPGDTEERFHYTVEEVIQLRPHMVRLHPTVVFRNTPLAEAYTMGEYEPLDMDRAVDLCKYALRAFESVDIAVIRVGLQMTAQMETEGSIVAGPYHPAFRSLVEGSILLEMASHLLRAARADSPECIVRLNPKDVSDFRGLNNQNMTLLKTRFTITDIEIRTDALQERGMLFMKIGDREYGIDKMMNETLKMRH